MMHSVTAESESVVKRRCQRRESGNEEGKGVEVERERGGEGGVELSNRRMCIFLFFFLERTEVCPGTTVYRCGRDRHIVMGGKSVFTTVLERKERGRGEEEGEGGNILATAL